MYITRVLTRTKKGNLSHTCILLRESYRENGKVTNRTIANLTHCKPEEVDAIHLALKHKDDLAALRSIKVYSAAQSAESQRDRSYPERENGVNREIMPGEE